LRKLLGDKTVRAEALEALGCYSIPGTADVAQSVKDLRSDSIATLIYAAFVLGRFQPTDEAIQEAKKAIPDLAARFDDEDVLLSRLCVRAVNHIGPTPNLVSGLKKLLLKPNSETEVRTEVVRVLTKIASKEAHSALLEAFADEKLNVNQQIADGLAMHLPNEKDVSMKLQIATSLAKALAAVLPQSNLEERSVRVSITCTEVPSWTSNRVVISPAPKKSLSLSDT